MGENVNATFDLYTGAAAPDRRQLARIAAGIALSVLVHGLLLALYRQPPAPSLPAAAGAAHRAPARGGTAAAVIPVAPAEPAPTPAKPVRRQAPPRPPRAVIAVEPEARQSSEETHAVPPAPVEAPAPRFDLDAARRTARRVAGEPDPARKGPRWNACRRRRCRPRPSWSGRSRGQAQGLQGWDTGGIAGAPVPGDGQEG
jgi:hypothetical protein